MNNENRWKQRFENLEKSFQVFQRRMDAVEKHPTDEGYQMALIQSFEITSELSWKTLKDYLENKGVECDSLPKNIIRKAFEAELISSAENWMTSIDIRNKTSHTYKSDIFEEVINFIRKHFYSLVRDLYFNLKKEL